MQYISDNKVTMEQEYIIENTDSIANGYQKWFFNNGAIKKYASVTRGVFDGYTYFYFPTGKLDRKEHFLLGRHCGQQISYYQNGNVKDIVYIPIQNYDTVATFGIKYDSTGKIRNIIGKLIQVYVQDFKEIYSIKDTISLINDVVVINGFHTALHAKLININSHRIYFDTLVKTMEYLSASDMHYHDLDVLLPKGNYAYIAKALLIDSVNNSTIKEDTHQYSFKVR
jgi:hypothetical protein